MANEQTILKNDIITVSYFIDKNSWESANKTSYHRILYFAAVLSPVFIPNEEWVYDFSNTFFGPYNKDISDMITELSNKGLLKVTDRSIYSNRVEERFTISPQGIKVCEDIIFKLDQYASKVDWFEIVIKTLSIYGETFLSKLIKNDPNVVDMNMINSYKKITIDNSVDNVSKEFFNYLKKKGINRLNLTSKQDKEFLLLFFDVLYRKYKGDQ
ncbi:hypothetical protein WYY_19104 [Bacillus velezensis M27]|uniref:hypothetical protein n=1 Tax=Bacillus amyloliquefaciens group TaxID=1938374 RepID=UPI00024165FE|nr:MULTISPECIES: hypothetical protein [Bacillus amyloliquefaciens group]AGF29176.1 hypothetical protein KSO_018475 [Bacillus amyloliquefaciens IT-45]AMP32890.1 hypothetical protein AS588_13040 [Bacillus amyloliquefaciens]ASF53796.1 hypothetical protein CEG11_01155 [Bacillus velezensis]EKE46028.1 hypothetical protein WYY_19104 [Bacillus velezensis M27]ERK81856.1 hypothetical protein N786_17945 [Bacillus amyloliquefaciens UASWS BA1]